MKELNRDLLRLEDIIQSISIIEGYVAKISFDQFIENEMMQSACIRHLEIIGEAASKLSETLKDKHVTIPWREIIAMRNIVVHEYFRVDLDEIWTTILHDLPTLKQQVVDILKDLN